MAENPWFSEAFGDFYTEVYAHRNEAEAKAHLPSIQKLAKLQNSSLNILDLGCGQGRYSALLQQEKHHVYSLDYSLDLLKQAQNNYASLNLLRGNMLSLPFKEHFDRVLSLFTSFAYFENDKENFEVLAQMCSCLKQDGIIYLDFLNANLVKESSWENKPLGSFMQRSRKMIHKQTNRVQKEIQLYQEGKLNYKYSEYVKLYGLDWFEQQVAKLPLSILQVYGDYEAGEFKIDSSPRLILLLKKHHH